LEFRDGFISVVGASNLKLSLAEIARAARPGWDNKLPAGIDPGLEETYYFEPPTAVWAYAAHCAVVEVDVKLGKVNIEKYVIVHDCGRIVNPMLVEGQVIGGTVQGIGGAMLEALCYDDQGQLLTASFMDYLLPPPRNTEPTQPTGCQRTRGRRGYCCSRGASKCDFRRAVAVWCADQ
jgi:carbon-monoxide dehydrogenase large subunit